MCEEDVLINCQARNNHIDVCQRVSPLMMRTSIFKMLTSLFATMFVLIRRYASMLLCVSDIAISIRVDNNYISCIYNKSCDGKMLAII